MVDLYRQAARQGHALSQFNLGCCYLEGVDGGGCDQDLECAKEWLDFARQRGNALATALAQQMDQLLSKPRAIIISPSYESCPICLEGFGPNRIAVLANSQGRHLYCLKCIRTIIDSTTNNDNISPRCALCRVVLQDLGQLQIAQLREEEEEDAESLVDYDEEEDLVDYDEDNEDVGISVDSKEEERKPQTAQLPQSCEQAEDDAESLVDYDEEEEKKNSGR